MKRGMVVVLLMFSVFLFCSSCSTDDLPDKGIAVLSPKANDLVPGELHTRSNGRQKIQTLNLELWLRLSSPKTEESPGNRSKKMFQEPGNIYGRFLK